MSGRLLSILAGFVFCAQPLYAEPGTNPLAAATFEKLLAPIQRYGSTEAKRESKRLAKEEMFRRGETALTWLMERIEIENDWILIMADNLVRQLPAEKAVPVLLPWLNAPSEQQRKVAAYWLGFHQAPEHASALLPLLEDKITAGSAMRTLGKWKVRAAIPGIRPWLTHNEERLRIRAVNALRDIAAPESIPDLIAATADPVFTVRKAASRALAAYGAAAHKQVIAALPGSEPHARRELIAVLGAAPSRRGISSLRRLLNDPDPLVREEAARALLRAAPAKAAAWVKQAGIEPAALKLPN